MPQVSRDWDEVRGEAVTFADPARDLPPLDRLEGLRPDGNGLYRRSLVAAVVGESTVPVWVYHMDWAVGGQRLRDGVWV